MIESQAAIAGGRGENRSLLREPSRVQRPPSGLIEATILVARSLGMGTVAEGIETEGQARELAQLRCDKGQGYLFAKPLSAADASRWLLKRSGTTIAA